MNENLSSAVCGGIWRGLVQGKQMELGRYAMESLWKSSDVDALQQSCNENVTYKY